MKEAWGMIGGDLLVSERCQSNSHGPGRKLSIKRFKTVPSVSGKMALMSVVASSTGWYSDELPCPLQAIQSGRSSLMK